MVRLVYGLSWMTPRQPCHGYANPVGFVKNDDEQVETDRGSLISVHV